MRVGAEGSPVPPLPELTARVASAAFDEDDIYLLLGDHAERLCAGLSFEHLYPRGRAAVAPTVLAMATVFQLVEGLSDPALVHAARTRIDWKYALHLPLSFAGLGIGPLGEFRRRLERDALAQAGLEELMRGLAALGYGRAVRLGERTAREALCGVATLNRLRLVYRAVCLALRALAARDPQWLRETVRSDWYDRYRDAEEPPTPATLHAREELVRAIGADGFRLLDALDGGGLASLKAADEIELLRVVWACQFERRSRDGRQPAAVAFRNPIVA